jgi:uncharacterized protein
MRTLTIRGIPEDVLARLRARAAGNHRSLNGEVLSILRRAAGDVAGPAAVAGIPGPAAAVAGTPGPTAAGNAGSAEAPAGAAADAVREPVARYGGADAPASDAATSLLDTIDRRALADVCRRHRIRWLAVFGSHARGDARPGSDVDVVVEFEAGQTPGLGFVRVADALRPVFGGRAVDLRTRRGLAPRLRDRILADARELYAA